jgi:hypothetical protein
MKKIIVLVTIVFVFSFCFNAIAGTNDLGQVAERVGKLEEAVQGYEALLQILSATAMLMGLSVVGAYIWLKGQIKKKAETLVEAFEKKFEERMEAILGKGKSLAEILDDVDQQRRLRRVPLAVVSVNGDNKLRGELLEDGFRDVVVAKMGEEIDKSRFVVIDGRGMSGAQVDEIVDISPEQDFFPILFPGRLEAGRMSRLVLANGIFTLFGHLMTALSRREARAK